MQNKLIIPISIIVAGALIGGAVIYTNKTPTQKDKTAVADTSTLKTANIKPVTSDDHILGNPDAKVLMVEYSDTECPFCQLFDTTMGKVMNTYGKDGTVAWVYRHFPIVSRHSKAPKEAEATECVNKLAGNEVFWKYMRKIYSVTPGNDGLDPEQLPTLAVKLGVNKKDFQSCLDSNIFTQKVQDSVADATSAGAQGTPYTVIISKKPISDTTAKQINDAFAAAAIQYRLSSPDQVGYVTTDKKIVLNGNLPFELIQQIIASIIS